MGIERLHPFYGLGYRVLLGLRHLYSLFDLSPTQNQYTVKLLSMRGL